MRARELAITGVWLFEPDVHRDDRGSFARTFDLDVYEQLGLVSQFVQHNQSRSGPAVLRGLHVRIGAGEAKVVRCSRGAVFEVVVDARPGPGFGSVELLQLDDRTMAQLYLPPGVAHGFQVLGDGADICYLHSERYRPDEDISWRWDDPTLGIEWPVRPPILSERDANAAVATQSSMRELLSPELWS